mgnify:CR=1 FL=1
MQPESGAGDDRLGDRARLLARARDLAPDVSQHLRLHRLSRPRTRLCVRVRRLRAFPRLRLPRALTRGSPVCAVASTQAPSPADTRPPLGTILERGALSRAEHVATLAAATALSAAVTALVLHSGWYGSLTALIFRSVFFSLMAAIGLIVVARARKWLAWRLALYALAAAVLVPGP